MNTLAARATYGKPFGTLLINGQAASIHTYSDLVGFVPQDDIMHDDLSVKARGKGRHLRVIREWAGSCMGDTTEEGVCFLMRKTFNKSKE